MDIEKYKQFIEWCKANKVKSFKNADIEFELSELSFIDEIDYAQSTDISTQNISSKTKEEDEDLLDLFWSAKP